jgi:hypothetical protein
MSIISRLLGTCDGAEYAARYHGFSRSRNGISAGRHTIRPFSMSPGDIEAAVSPSPSQGFPQHKFSSYSRPAVRTTIVEH